MAIVSIGPCGCCGSSCPVSWRFTFLKIDFQYINMPGSGDITNCYLRGRTYLEGAYAEVELTYADGTTSIETIPDGNVGFIGNFSGRVSHNQGSITINDCRATWSAEWEEQGPDVYQFYGTMDNVVTINYGDMETISE